MAAMPAHYRPIFTCLAWTGARPGELMDLRWNDVDFVRGEIRINKARVKGVQDLPKTGSSERYIPMLPPVREALDELKAAGTVKSLDGSLHVFLNKNGQPFDQGLDQVWARVLRKAGLRHRPSYQLRHTFASLCLQQGVNPGWVSKVLGHSTMQTTFRHYARFIQDPNRINEQLMANMFSPVTSSSSSTGTLQKVAN